MAGSDESLSHLGSRSRVARGVSSAHVFDKHGDRVERRPMAAAVKPQTFFFVVSEGWGGVGWGGDQTRLCVFCACIVYRKTSLACQMRAEHVPVNHNSELCSKFDELEQVYACLGEKDTFRAMSYKKTSAVRF